MLAFTRNNLLKKHWFVNYEIFIFGATFEFPRESDIVCVNRGVSSINGGAINSPSTSCITDPIRKIFFSPPMEPLDNNGNNTIT